MTCDNIIPFPGPMQGGTLRRPALLIRAAKLGQAGWRRERDLRKLLKCDEAPPVGVAMRQLRATEAAVNAARKAGAAEYDMQRHVALMIAILAELRAVAASAVTQTPAVAMKG